jgi:hypothetical protein
MRADLLLVVLVCLGTGVEADVLVRWDQADVPPAMSLGISSLVIPAANAAVIEKATAQGYVVYVEDAAAQQVTHIRPRDGSPRGKPLTLDTRGTWPHIRTNWVTKNKEVLQVTSRSAQPWIENNAALLRIMRSSQPGVMPLLAYPWKPITVADADRGPAIENYLVAIAEAGSFGGDLLLRLHERFETDLLLGKPEARAGWNEIRRYIEFYSWNLPAKYRPLANIGVVTGEPMRWFELMNLLARHNLPFELIAPGALATRDLTPFTLLIVPGEAASQGGVLAEFARRGGTVVTPKQVGDPNRFAFEIRQKLGKDNRIIDLWNGITVIAAPYQEPDGTAVLVTALNYASQPLPVQMRVRGTFSLVHYESPEEPMRLLPYEHRDGFTEFLLPALRIGGRVFLSGSEPRSK